MINYLTFIISLYDTFARVRRTYFTLSRDFQSLADLFDACKPVRYHQLFIYGDGRPHPWHQPFGSQPKDRLFTRPIPTYT